MKKSEKLHFSLALIVAFAMIAVVFTATTVLGNGTITENSKKDSHTSYCKEMHKQMHNEDMPAWMEEHMDSMHNDNFDHTEMHAAMHGNSNIGMMH